MGFLQSQPLRKNRTKDGVSGELPVWSPVFHEDLRPSSRSWLYSFALAREVSSLGLCPANMPRSAPEKDFLAEYSAVAPVMP
jgi:hypothetical protein